MEIVDSQNDDECLYVIFYSYELCGMNNITINGIYVTLIIFALHC